MKRLIALAAVILCIGTNARGQTLNVTNTQNVIRTTFASEQITVATVSIGFTAATINPTSGGTAGVSRATAATCVNQTAEIRITTSSTAPTTSLGLPIAAGQSFTIYGYANIAAFRAIRTTGTSGTLDCMYSRVQ